MRLRMVAQGVARGDGRALRVERRRGRRPRGIPRALRRRLGRAGGGGRDVAVRSRHDEARGDPGRQRGRRPFRRAPRSGHGARHHPDARPHRIPQRRHRRLHRALRGGPATERPFARMSSTVPRREYRYYEFVLAAFVTILICSNLIGPAKIAQLDFPLIGAVTFGAGVLFFPISYVICDVLTEVYGYARSRRVIWCGFAGLPIASFMSYVVVRLLRAT